VAAKTKFVPCHVWDFSGVTGRWDYGFLWASFSLCKYLNIAEIPGTHFLSTYLKGVVSSVEFWILKGWAGSSNYDNRLTYKQRAQGFKDCVCHRQNNRRRADMWYTSRTFAHRRRSAPIISLYYFKNHCAPNGVSLEKQKKIYVSAGIMLYGFLVAADLASSAENGRRQGINAGCSLAGITHQTECSPFFPLSIQPLFVGNLLCKQTKQRSFPGYLS